LTLELIDEPGWSNRRVPPLAAGIVHCGAVYSALVVSAPFMINNQPRQIGVAA
jgi:hypothetical protein